ncbi:MAG: CYTH domain-containing protein [Verrucomicrobiota bacterium]
MEVELQYVYRGDAPPVVPTRLADLVLADSESFRLTDTYFDTDELDLRQAGCSLRVRVSDDDGRAKLTWKGRSRRHKSGKRRPEIEVPIASVPAEPEILAALLDRHGIDRLIGEACGSSKPLDLNTIGEIRSDRSRHTYVQGLHRLELTWDQLEYPVGPPETRVEVEVKSKLAERYLVQAEEDLRGLFGDDLEAPARGKVRELCTRLYPELVSA